jgi:DNA primase small subunit
LNPATVAFLRQAYREYYFREPKSIEFPSDVSSREFGYMPFGGGMVRHLSFRSEGEAVAEILKQSPSSVYCSNAKYESPAAPIEAKGWLGAELYCAACGASGKLPRAQKCPKCGRPVAEFHGTCETCLSAARDHALRVMSFLTDDFGVPEAAVAIYFSGNRGYHLYVSDERFRALKQSGRGEIAEYILGTSLPPNQAIASALRRNVAGAGRGPEGWMGRISRYAEAKKDGYTGTLQRLVADAIASQRATIDSSVTTDVHRVFRLAGTLHGETGMRKMRVKSIGRFDPQRDPVALGSKSVALNVSFYPRFRMNGAEFGPFRSQMAELPTFAAVSILTRGLGEVA